MPNRPSGRARATRLLLVLTTLATLMLATAGTATAAHEFDTGSYTAAGSGTTGVSAHNTGVQLSYDHSSFSGSWSFTATADQTGPLTFDWVYSFFHSWFMPNANLRVFANGPTGQTSTTLVSSTSSGGLLVVGTATINLTDGYTYGFNITGSNSDSSRILSGDVYIFPDTDVTAPVVTPTVTGTLGDNGWYVGDVAVSWSVVEDETIVYSQSGCGPQTVTTDTAGTSFTCTATSFGGTTVSTVTIMRDTAAPVISVAGETTVPSTGPDGAYVDVSVTAADNLDPAPVVVCDPTLNSLFPIGVTDVSCTATDAAGNVASEPISITVTDAEPPVLTVPEDIIVSNDPGEAGATVLYSATATDNMGSVTVECAPDSGSFFPLGTTTVDCTATDSSDNTASDSFSVTVNDDENPVLTVPADIVVSNDSGEAGANVTFDATATDNSGSVTVVCAPDSGTFFALGTTTVDCTATDPTGNTDSGSFSVTVNDDEAPLLSVPDNIVVPADSPDGSIVTFDATATDNSGSVTVECVPESGSLFAAGTTTVMCTATDPTGNTATGSFTVTVDSGVALINALREQVQATVANAYFRTQLTNYLDQALLWESRGQDQRAALYMDQFIDRVKQYRGTVLSPELADDFIAQAEQIMAALGHSGAPDPRK